MDAPNQALAIIDLADWDGSREGSHHLAETMDEVCRDLGFFCIVGHGVPQHLIERMHGVTAAFFQLPEEQKMRFAADRSTGMRGYEPAGDRGLGRSLSVDTPPDVREIFGSSRPLPEDSGTYFRDVEYGRFFFSGTNWPNEPSDFRDVWNEYYAELERLSLRLYRLMEVALELEPGWFTPFIDRHGSMMIANYYPHAEYIIEGQLRAGAHTDYGAFTIVHQDDAPGGLQVAGNDGSWIDVAPRADSFVVNIGDLLARWTNDRWVSTLHRVVPPPQDSGGSPWRISIPFFQQPNPDALIDCVPGCEGVDESRFEPVTSGRNWYEKNRSTLTNPASI